MENENLKLENQICFPLYALSRLITKEYHPLLTELNITYPQYLVLLVLWEKDGQSINDITKKLLLNTNTTTPLIQRMEKEELIYRTKSDKDERKFLIQLTEKGRNLKSKAECIPEKLIEKIATEHLNKEDIIQFKNTLHQLIKILK